MEKKIRLPANMRVISPKDYDTMDKYYYVLGSYVDAGWKFYKVKSGWIVYLEDESLKRWLRAYRKTV